MNSTGAARLWVGIFLGTVLSFGVLAFTALWRPPDVKEPSPAERSTLPPERPGPESFPPENEPGTTETTNETESGAEFSPAGTQAPPAGEESSPGPGESPPKPAPVKERKPQKPAREPVSNPAARPQEDINESNESLAPDRVQEEGKTEGENGTPPEGDTR